jgi:hypothetical protein
MEKIAQKAFRKAIRATKFAQILPSPSSRFDLNSSQSGLPPGTFLAVFDAQKRVKKSAENAPHRSPLVVSQKIAHLASFSEPRIRNYLWNCRRSKTTHFPEFFASNGETLFYAPVLEQEG